MQHLPVGVSRSFWLADLDAIHCHAIGFVRQRLWRRYGNTRRHEVAIYRPLNLTPQDVQKIVAGAESYVGRTYGWLKAAAHLGDWLLLGAYFWRRFARMDRYPICSWLVAHAYEKAGKHFGVEPGEASPDDIWDFVTTRPDVYRAIHPLGRLLSGQTQT